MAPPSNWDLWKTRIQDLSRLTDPIHHMHLGG